MVSGRSSWRLRCVRWSGGFLSQLRINALTVTVAAAGLLTSAPAGACGGCFAPVTETPSVVTGHRMAYAVSAERTVLWDQFEYSGSPEDFAWVLPVRPGAYIEESNDAWFEALEAMTQVRVSAPALQCASGSNGGCGCTGLASEDASALGGAGFQDPGVEVIHRGTVGPYATETLRSTSGDALSGWLVGHGYNIPGDIEPIIAAYVDEGADFIALRLQPGFGVQQMTPVRVITPGGDAILPLRMVAAGTGLRVPIVLYAIGEERLALPDLERARIRPEQVTWDFGSNGSNYDELREQALRGYSGFAFLTAFADRGFFSKRYSSPTTTVGSFVAGAFRDNFADLYFAQAEANLGRTSGRCASVRTKLESDQLVREAPGTGELGASEFTCESFSDLSAAVIGMRPARIWTTRLEMDLPREALGMDCVVSPDPEQTTVSQLIQAQRSVNRPQFCEEPVFESRMARSRSVPAGAWLVALLLPIAFRLHQRWRRRS